MATVRLFNNYVRIPFILLGIVEATAFFLTVYLAVMVRYPDYEMTFTQIILSQGTKDISLLASVYTVLMMLSMIALGHYQSQQHFTPSIFTETVLRCSVALSLGSLVLMVIYYIFPQVHIGRGVNAIAIVLSFTAIIVIRALFFHFIGRNVLKKRVLVIGAGNRAETLIQQKGGAQDGMSYRLVGYIPIQGEDTAVPDGKVINLDGMSVSDYVFENEIDELILAIEDRRKSYPVDELLKCKLAGVDIIEPVSFLEREQGKVNLEMLNPSWVIFSPGFQRNDFKNFNSRTFDIISSLMILISTLPVLLITAFLIALESRFKHPIFYRQTRVGMDGETFELLKFRSMRVDAEKDGKAVWASQKDDRITAIGKFIRKTRVDELPQILNILKGDMRLVGPRPERPEFVDQLAEKIPFYRQRHTVKPGLAGWAQLKYPYGATEQDAYEKLQYDLYYVKNHNVIMDFFILLQTIEVVIMGKGAR